MLSSPLIFDPFAIKNWTRETVGKTRLVYGDLGEWAAQKSPFPERYSHCSWTDCFCLGNKKTSCKSNKNRKQLCCSALLWLCSCSVYSTNLILCRFPEAASSEQGSWPSQGIGTWPCSAHSPVCLGQWLPQLMGSGSALCNTGVSGLEPPWRPCEVRKASAKQWEGKKNDLWWSGEKTIAQGQCRGCLAEWDELTICNPIWLRPQLARAGVGKWLLFSSTFQITTAWTHVG